MNTTSFWDANAQQRYIDSREASTERQAQWRESLQHAENPQKLWLALSDEERTLLQWMLLNETPSLVGHCDDAVLQRLLTLGVLHWPPGVRPVLTDDLVTTFHMGPALWSVLLAQRDEWLPQGISSEELKASLAVEMGDRWLVLQDAGQSSPLALRASS